jgi:glucose 1-dehydrogenase
LNDPVKLRELLENTPLGRLGNSEDVAGIASFLASENSDYVMRTALFVTGLLWNYQEQ